MRAVCWFAENWLHCTPSRALVLLSENDDDFEIMLAWRAYDSKHTNWLQTQRDNKIKFIEIVRVLRRRESRILDDVNAEYNAVIEEAIELSYRHHGDPKSLPDDDLETRVQAQTERDVNPQRVAARFMKG